MCILGLTIISYMNPHFAEFLLEQGLNQKKQKTKIRMCSCSYYLSSWSDLSMTAASLSFAKL